MWSEPAPCRDPGVDSGRRPAPGRAGVLDAIARRRRENRAEGQRLRTMLRHENTLWSAGVVHVAGVDEAGMSPLAGPVAAAAVILAPGTRIPDVDDSKRLQAAERERWPPHQGPGRGVGGGFAEVEEIDRINIYWAGLLAMRRAVRRSRPRPSTC